MKPAVRAGALPSSATACSPLVSSSVAWSLPNFTRPSMTDKRGRVGLIHGEDKFGAFHPGHGAARDDAGCGPAGRDEKMK